VTDRSNEHGLKTNLKRGSTRAPRDREVEQGGGAK
jgi:hypothetical protein